MLAKNFQKCWSLIIAGAQRQQPADLLRQHAGHSCTLTATLGEVGQIKLNTPAASLMIVHLSLRCSYTNKPFLFTETNILDKGYVFLNLIYLWYTYIKFKNALIARPPKTK